jgi:DNA (cytosine-5)-methyltransferase 1
MKDLRFVDLFSGIGGFRYALASSKLSSRWHPVGWSDSDPEAAAIYRRLHSPDDGEIFVNDVHNIRTKGSGAPGSVSLPDFDLLLAGFPCQAFSNVGHRLGLDDERGQLVFEIQRILRQHQPRWFVLENVQKLATIDRGALLAQILGWLRECGYHVQTYDLVASDYGLPQQRRRLFFCGVRADKVRDHQLPPPPKVAAAKARYPTAWHLLERAMPERHLLPTKTRRTVLRKNPKWAGDVSIDRAVARPICASMAKWHRANQDNYYSATYVSASNTNPWSAPDVDLDSEPIRRITPLEALRLQGFPDSAESAFSHERLALTATYRLIGNAVPVALTREVIDHWLGAQQ